MRRDSQAPAWVAVASLLALALLSGCSSEAAGVSAPLDEAAAEAACLANQQTFETEVLACLINNPDTRMRLDYRSLLTAVIVQTGPECPADGDLVWDPTSATLNCSIDGHWD